MREHALDLTGDIICFIENSSISMGKEILKIICKIRRNCRHKLAVHFLWDNVYHSRIAIYCTSVCKETPPADGENWTNNPPYLANGARYNHTINH